MFEATQEENSKTWRQQREISQQQRQTCRQTAARLRPDFARLPDIATGRRLPSRSRLPAFPDQHEPKSQDQIPSSVSYRYQIPEEGEHTSIKQHHSGGQEDHKRDQHYHVLWLTRPLAVHSQQDPALLPLPREPGLRRLQARARALLNPTQWPLSHRQSNRRCCPEHGLSGNTGSKTSCAQIIFQYVLLNSAEYRRKLFVNPQYWC